MPKKKEVENIEETTVQPKKEVDLSGYSSCFVCGSERQIEKVGNELRCNKHR